MKPLRAFMLRLFGFIRRNKHDKEQNAELESHIQMHIDDNLRSGMTQAEARRDALIKLGGVEQTRQAYRERGTLPSIECLVQDIRFGLRMMLHNRAFTVVTILTLTIGIGASTTVFSWIDAVLLRPLSGVADPGLLVDVESITANHDMVPNSYPDYQDFRDHLHLIDIAVRRPAVFSVGQADHAERVWGELVSGNFFAVLGVQPELGRVFLPAEYGDTPGAFPIVVLSDGFWRSHFHADPNVIGRTLRINQHELTIVGIAPAAFHGSMPAAAFDLWVPYMQQPTLNRNMLGIARIKPGLTVQQATHELSTLAARMAIADADSDEGLSATLLPLWKSPHGAQALLAAPLQILMGISLLVLLIVCTNVANLLLARAAAREKEFSTRLALGAGRGRLARQALTESLMFALAGGVTGIGIAIVMGCSLKLLLPSGQLSLALGPAWNSHILLFTAGLCAFIALFTGAAPVLHLRRINLNERLNEGGRSGTGSLSSHRLRSVLVIAEISLALVTLIGAGLFTRSFAATSHIYPGFDPDHVLLSQFYLSTSGYNLEQRKAFCRRLSEALESTPGVTNTAYSDGVPLGFEASWWEELHIEGYTPALGENMKLFRNVISPGYLPLMKIPLVEGRNFTEHDDGKADGVIIVNQEFVRRFYAGRDPIGHRIHGWGDWFTVIGVAADSKYHYLGESPLPYAYFAVRQVYRADMNLAFYVRAQQDPASMIATLRREVKEIDPNVTVVDPVPLREFIGASLYSQKVAASLLAVMGILAVLLAAVGIYSVMAYAVVQRTREIGIRMALGAAPRQILTSIVKQGLALCAIGLPVGLLLTFFLARSASSVSFTGTMGGGEKLLRASASDPLIYLAAAAFLCGVTVLAAFVPARRAAHVDPMVALRSE
jgi:predicted permease